MLHYMYPSATFAKDAKLTSLPLPLVTDDIETTKNASATPGRIAQLNEPEKDVREKKLK